MDITKWSYQRIFNKVSKHLINQNKKAMKEGLCVCYDPENGQRCAIGCLMPISFYKKGNEDICLTDLLTKINIKNSWNEINYILKNFLNDLQDIHDHCKPSRWPQKLRAFARKNNLTIPDYLKKK